MPRQQFQQAYTREQVLRVSGVSERQLRIWERAGLITTHKDYALSDLKALQTLWKMKQGGLGPKHIRSVFTAIREKLDGIHDPLSQVTVMLDHGDVHVLIDGQKMHAESGQLLFNFDQVDISRLLSFPAEKQKEREQASEQKRIAEAADWFQRGLELEQSGLDKDEAVSAYERALELDPGCVGALVNLGTIFFHARQWKRALGCYKKAIGISPDYALGHFNLANLYDERGDVAAALQHYQAAIKAAPEYADAHYNMALLCQRTGQTMRAQRHWRTYLKLDPGSSWSEVARRELAKLRDASVVRHDPDDHPTQGRVVS